MTLVPWLIAAALARSVLRLRRRLELVACAEHELRGPLTAFALAAESVQRGRSGPALLDAELRRAQTALADLSAARSGRRATPSLRAVDLERSVRSAAAAWGARVEWRAGAAPVVADEGRIAQTLGNLLANAVEHGTGAVTVHARRQLGSVLLAVANPIPHERGRGLRIAAAAARDAGGRLALQRDAGEFRATLDLPLAR